MCAPVGCAGHAKEAAEQAGLQRHLRRLSTSDPRRQRGCTRSCVYTAGAAQASGRMNTGMVGLGGRGCLPRSGGGASRPVAASGRARRRRTCAFCPLSTRRANTAASGAGRVCAVQRFDPLGGRLTCMRVSHSHRFMGAVKRVNRNLLRLLAGAPSRDLRSLSSSS